MSEKQRKIKALMGKIQEADRDYRKELLIIGSLYYSMHPNNIPVTQLAIYKRCGQCDALCMKIKDYENQIKELQS